MKRLKTLKIKNIKTVILMVVVASLWFCGKKGPLKLEPLLLPKKVELFQVTQVGDTVKLWWTFPDKLEGKGKNKKVQLENITKIHVYYSNRELLGGKFLKKADLLKKLKPEDLTPAGTTPPLPGMSTGSSGERSKELSFYIEIPFKLKELDNTDHFFALQYHYLKKKSPLGPVVHIRTVAPVKPVSNLTVQRENKIVKLTWSRPGLDEAGHSVGNIVGYNVFRKIEPEKTDDPPTETEEEPVKKEPVQAVFEKINRANVLREYYEDPDTGTNGTYSYYVSAVVSNRIESAPCDAVAVNITDIFPPDIPANLVCFRAADHLFLTWQVVRDTDLSHYRLYRRKPGENEFQMVADNITGASHKDTDVRKRRTYFYVVTAVDTKGNESEYSNEVQERFE